MVKPEKPNDEHVHDMRWICKDCGYIGKSHSHRNCIDDLDKQIEKALAEVKAKLLREGFFEIKQWRYKEDEEMFLITKKDFNKVFKGI